jgi:hypothetical protein
MPLLPIFSFLQATPLTTSGYLHGVFDYEVVLCTEHCTVGLCVYRTPHPEFSNALSCFVGIFSSLFLAGGQHHQSFWSLEGLMFVRAGKLRDAVFMLNILRHIFNFVLQEIYQLGTSGYQLLSMLLSSTGLY